MKTSIILDTDSYKFSHPQQTHDSIESMYSYAEARAKGEFTIFMGLQPILKTLQQKITPEDVLEAKEYNEFHGTPFEYDDWMYIATELEGKLPIRIRAIPEGTKVPTQNVLFTLESTDPRIPTLGGHLETALMRCWYSSNIATESYKIKQILLGYAEETQDNPNVDYSLHNFGSRGSSSAESAMLGGMAHLTQFKGTDNFTSIKGVAELYGMKDRKGEIGHSIRASEHSQVTSYAGTFEDKFIGEMEFVENFILKSKGALLIACVADSYDYLRFVDAVTSYNDFKIRELIENPEYPTFVIRPDSGIPAEIIPQTLDIMEKNEVKFTTNDKGFKVWDSYSIIWGDGICEDEIKIMLDILKERGYSSECLSFGMGGALMAGNDTTSNNRDTQAWAIKCSSATLKDGTEIDVYKDPITAPNKKSKKGKVSTYRRKDGTYFVDLQGKKFTDAEDALVTVFENGEILKEYNFEEVRNNSMA